MGKPRLRPLQDRGAVLVHVGIALLLLLGFSAIVLDYGILWVSRRQAQNAADAGALAGAISMAFDGDDRTTGGIVATRAAAAANQNAVWGQAAGVTPTVPEPISFPTCPDGTDTCVRVNVYRNVGHANALPVFFARLFGVANQGVQAMATAQAGYATASRCLKPWAIPDKWEEHYPQPPTPALPWSWNSAYDLYYGTGNLKDTLLPSEYQDRYDGREFQTDAQGNVIVDASGNPVLNMSYTGYKDVPPWPSPGDIGTMVRFKVGDPHQALTPGWFLPIDLPITGVPDTGGSNYRDNIAACNPNVYVPGELVSLVNEPGNMIGPTSQGVEALIASDPGSFWDATMNGGLGGVGCNPSLGACTQKRLIKLPVFDPHEYTLTAKSGRATIRITKIIGFFLDSVRNDDVFGYFTGTTGELGGSGNQSSFLRVIRLVR